MNLDPTDPNVQAFINTQIQQVLASIRLTRINLILLDQDGGISPLMGAYIRNELLRTCALFPFEPGADPNVKPEPGPAPSGSNLPHS